MANEQDGQAQQGQAAGGQAQGAGQGQTQTQNRSQSLPLADLNRIVLEYLNKKGYNRTEAMLRIESSRASTPSGLTNSTNGQNNNVGNRNTKPSPTPTTTPKVKEDPKIMHRAYAMIKDWTEHSLDMYQSELRRLCYPIFVHMFLRLVELGHAEDARRFFDEFSVDFEVLHGQDIEKLSGISLETHLQENDLAKAFLNNKYRLNVSQTAFDLLLYFLQEIESNGGTYAMRTVNQHLDVKCSASRPVKSEDESSLDPTEGLPGLGSTKQDEQVDKFNSQAVKLGQMQPDQDFDKEITLALEQRDEKEKVENGPTLVQQYQKIKQEFPADDGPNRETLPLPQYKSIDVDREIETIKEARNRITVGTGAQGAALPSVCMYTFHNTHDGLNCLEFSDDSELVAGGFSDSFVKIWSLTGEKLNSVLKDDEPSASKRLVGHSGAVFGTSFSPDNRYLLSCSEDETVRLWSTDTFTGLVSYKGHNHPVWDVKFSPFGHYFATASHDQTARLWSCDHIYPLRIFAGHLSDVDCVDFHPNGTYVLTGSSDKTCRMWDINKGNSVRVFMGHTQAVNAIATSPDGRWLASACEDGIINVWDLGSGRKLKSMKGHGKTFIYSLAFSRDGNVLVSCGADNSVRVWDIKRGTNDAGPEPEPMPSSAGGSGGSSGGAAASEQSSSGSAQGSSGSTNGSANANSSSANTQEDKRKKEIVATADHMAVFHTKKTPVYKVHFTRRNLCFAAGAFMG